MPRTIRLLFYGVFFFSAFLRLSLCLVNREANDDHFEVVSRILDGNRLPGREKCDQCYQPKLYHVLTAQVITSLHINSRESQIITAQMITGIAGIATMLLAFFLIVRLPGGNYRAKLFAFSFLAFNPALIAINGQITNDTFVILFGTGTFFLLCVYLEKGGWPLFLSLIAATTAAGASKGNGLLLFPIVLAVLFAQLFFAATKSDKSAPFFQKDGGRRTMVMIVRILLFVLLFSTLVTLLGNYANGNKRFTVATNIETMPPHPPFFKDDFMTGVWPQRAGVSSVVSSYATFRFFDLLKHPVLLWWKKAYPRHRTSLWTQLYGRAFFAQFDCWPRSWIMTNWYIGLLGKAIFILSLLPVLLGIIGGFSYCNSLFRSIKSRQFVNHCASFEWVLPLGAAAYVGFIIAYTWLYRDYSTMKPIFMYPAILCFMKLLYDGMVFCGKKWGAVFTYGTIPLSSILLLLFAADIGLLVRHLWTGG